MSSNRLKLCPQCNGNIRTEYSSSSSLYVTSLWSINTCLCALGDAGFRRYSLRFPAEKQKCNKNLTSHKLGPLNSYMPYLTLWDKISPNLAHLEANSHKIFQISQNFQTILQHILWRNKHKSHFMFITSFIHKNKGFWLFWEKFSDFYKKLTELCQISLKNLPYLTDLSP